MKKGIIVALVVLCLTAFSGCSKDKQGETAGEVVGVTESVKPEITNRKFVSEDYKPGNRTKNLGPMMKTEKGFYHYVYEDKGIRYYDMTTGKNMMLCNKPECRHDGNEFCVATNSRYLTLNQCMYNNTIFKYAFEETDTKYLFKVFIVALDGSSMDEVATVLEMEKPTEGFSIYQSRMYIHRNKVLLTMCGAGQEELEDTEHNGVAILDLDTREVTYLGEEPFSKNNIGIEMVTAAGDYFYFCQKEGKEMMLHRYHIGNGTDESYKLLPGFAGDYVVLDDDTVAYIKSSGTAICTLCFSTGENLEKTSLLREFYEWNGVEYKLSETKKMSKMVGLETDGTYIYAPEGHTGYVGTRENGEQYVIRRDAYIHVLNKDMEEVVLVDMAAAAASLGFDDMEWNESGYTQMLRYMGEDIYWYMTPKSSRPDEKYVFRCNRSDFLNGEPKFEFLYQYTGD